MFLFIFQGNSTATWNEWRNLKNSKYSGFGKYNWSGIPLLNFLRSTCGKCMHALTNFLMSSLSIPIDFNKKILCHRCGKRMIYTSWCALQYLGYFYRVMTQHNQPSGGVGWDPALVVLQVATFFLAYTLCLLCLGIPTSFYFLYFWYDVHMYIPPLYYIQHQQGPVFPIIY